jgi:hypothetical protein
MSILSEMRRAGRWARVGLGAFGFQPFCEFLIASLVTADVSRVLSEHPTFRTRSNYAKSNPYGQNTRATRQGRVSSMMNVLSCAIDSTGHAFWPS